MSYHCLRESDADCFSYGPDGPYPSEAAALAAAREAAGYCPHGCDDDETCEPCDGSKEGR